MNKLAFMFVIRDRHDTEWNSWEASSSTASPFAVGPLLGGTGGHTLGLDRRVRHKALVRTMAPATDTRSAIRK